MIHLNAAAMTDKGHQRDVNEDRVWEQIFEASEGEPVGLFIVCDGMGGHLAGEFASHWAVEAIKQEMADFFVQRDPRATVFLSQSEIEAVNLGAKPTRKLPISSMEERVRASVLRANTVLRGYARKKPKQAGDLGSTVTVAMIKGDRAVIANVGDSRTYLLRDHRLRQITQDHSLVASLVTSGQIKPEDIYTHPQRNVIYRSLGQKGDVLVDTFKETLQAGDYLLLCSDGLWEMVRDERLITNIIETHCEPKEACQRLIDAANHLGGEDNIGVVVVKVV